MGNIKVTIAYDGTNYYGFQEQRGTGLATVQSVLEECIEGIACRSIPIIGAGRTDTGVHARGQVISFSQESWPVPLERTVYALNSVLPRDIAAVAAEEKPDSFHPRFSAKAKRYCYTIYNGQWPAPLHRLYSYHIPHKLDLSAMQRAALDLIGEKDFSAFRALGTPVKTTVRLMHRIEVTRTDDFVHISLCANGFLYHMARMIAGTLLRIGMGRIPAGEIKSILENQSSFASGPSLPARGLCLEEVMY